MSGKRNRKKSFIRKDNATKSVNYLSSLIDDNSHPDIILNSVARSILRIGKKHGIRPNKNLYKKICRNCQKVLIPGRTLRVRVSNNFLQSTCLNCGKIRRRKFELLNGE